jgi:hypothetical protein
VSDGEDLTGMPGLTAEDSSDEEYSCSTSDEDGPWRSHADRDAERQMVMDTINFNVSEIQYPEVLRCDPEDPERLQCYREYAAEMSAPLTKDELSLSSVGVLDQKKVTTQLGLVQEGATKAKKFHCALMDTGAQVVVLSPRAVPKGVKIHELPKKLHVGGFAGAPRPVQGICYVRFGTPEGSIFPKAKAYVVDGAIHDIIISKPWLTKMRANWRMRPTGDVLTLQARGERVVLKTGKPSKEETCAGRIQLVGGPETSTDPGPVPEVVPEVSEDGGKIYGRIKLKADVVIPARRAGWLRLVLSDQERE